MRKIEDEHSLLKEKEAAAYLNLSPRTVWGMRNQGILPHFKLGKKTIRFKKADLDSYLDRNRVG